MSSKKAKAAENFTTHTFYVDDDKTLILADSQVVATSARVKKGFIRVTTVSVDKPGKPIVPVLCCAIAQDAAMNPHVMVRGGHLVVLIDDNPNNMGAAAAKIAEKLDMENPPMAITLGIIEKTPDGKSWVDVGLFTCIPSLVASAETVIYNSNYIVSWRTRGTQETKGLTAHKEHFAQIFEPLIDRMTQSKTLRREIKTEFSDWALPKDDHPWLSNSWGESPIVNNLTVGRHMLWISQIWKYHKLNPFDNTITNNIKSVYNTFAKTEGITELSATIFMALVMLYDTAMAQSSGDIPYKSASASDSMSPSQIRFDILFVRASVNKQEDETKKFYTKLHSASPGEVIALLSKATENPSLPMSELSKNRVNRFESVTLETAHRVMTRVSDERNALHMASHEELLGLAEMSQARKGSRSRSRSKSRGRSRSAKPKKGASTNKSRSRSRSRSSKTKGGSSKSKSRSRARSATPKKGASKSKSRSRSRSATPKKGASKSKSRSRSRSATPKKGAFKSKSRSSSAKPKKGATKSKSRSRSRSTSTNPKEKASKSKSRSRSSSTTPKGKSKSRSRSSSSNPKGKAGSSSKTNKSKSKSKSRSRSSSPTSKPTKKTRSKSTSTDKKPEDGKKTRSRSQSSSSESRGRSKTRSRRNSDTKKTKSRSPSKGSTKKSSRSRSPSSDKSKAKGEAKDEGLSSVLGEAPKKKERTSKSRSRSKEPKSAKEADNEEAKRGRSKSRSKSRGRNSRDNSSERRESPSRRTTNINLRFGGKKTVSSVPTSTPAAVVPMQPVPYRDDFFYQQRLSDLENDNARLENRQRQLDLQLRQTQVENERKEIERQQGLLEKERTALTQQRSDLDRYMNEIAEKQQLQRQQQQQTEKPLVAMATTSPNNVVVATPSAPADTPKVVDQQATFSSHVVAEALSRFYAY